MTKRTILIVDDEPHILKQLEKILKRNYFNTILARNGKTALEICLKKKIDIVLLDIKLFDINGITVLSKIKKIKPDCAVIIITGYGTQDIAIQSLRKGAIDYIEKPINIEELKTALGRALEKLSEKEKICYNNTLLIIDDNKKTAANLKKFLQKEGYEVLSAYCGKEGIDIVEHHKIDVIITDIKMKDINGIEVLKKAKKIHSSIEGIMITGYRDEESAIKSLRAGAIDYIPKPVNLDELSFSIKRAIERISLNCNKLYRSREQKITSKIITKMNEELERRIKKRTKQLDHMQVQLFQTSKLATLGEMSAGLAHEINQPLGAISLVVQNIEQLKDKNKLSDEELDSCLTDINTSIKRMTKIIQHIRTFARQDTLKFTKININDTINSAFSLLNEQLRLHEIKIVKKISKNLPLMYAEPYQLEQVWINLISNARDASDEKVKLKNKGKSNAPVYRKKIKISTHYDNKSNTIEIQITDNGIGMLKKEVEKAFEPFYTTKEVGKATGLGLSISYGIIESHNGKIEINSYKMRGTTIKVILPVEQKDAENINY